MIKRKILVYGADFLLLLVALSWGSTFFIVQDAISDTPVYIFLFWRFFFSSILMAIVAHKHLLSIDKDTLKAGVLLGIFVFFGFAFQTFGLITIYSSTSAFITGLCVIIVPFLLFVIFKNRVSVYSIFGAVCAALGLYLLTQRGAIGMGRGELYTLICAFMFAIHIVYTDRFAKKYNVLLLAMIQLSTVAVLSFVAALVYDHKIMPHSFDGLFLDALIVTVLFATVFAYGVQTAMQRYTTPAKTAIIFTMEPLSAGVFGYYFADEVFSFAQLSGAFMILFGMLLAELGTYFRNKKLDSCNQIS